MKGRRQSRAGAPGKRGRRDCCGTESRTRTTERLAAETAEQERLAKEAEERVAAEQIATEKAKQERLSRNHEERPEQECLAAEGEATAQSNLQQPGNKGQLQQGTSHDKGVTTEDVEKLLDGMLQGNPEQKTMGSHDIQGCDLLVEGPSEATGNAHAEEE
ncbi:uncharacterized protein ASPGLDRAFT_50077 [Aspergillus glaucus CBS 516.65]|uniref:Uncharacterized protein n=1 Tax=Aspergillus glaucus CBS 516.65 TaxID=1160497 RepID=A0A1L9VC88_ASPGL|nr:hypothetical protein ASPGLDRAFT_50077 [Aspergillus glaucus CBS 516.65]OJJ81551.1 hypothetical protein ASPGLDRAFT_50077 [Aspergillus glaucus CBS 516.65]